MKKSENITKYSVKWQLLRASIKGGKTSFEVKLDKVLFYLREEGTIDAWERVYNFLEGLQRGYVSSGDDLKINIIEEALQVLKLEKTNIKEVLSEVCEIKLLMNTSFSDRYCLYKDLYLRSKKWLEGGYIHKEQEAFIDKLIDIFNTKSESHLIQSRYEFASLYNLREKASLMKNKHKFFF